MPCPVVVGREPELEAVRTALGEALLRRGQALAILGEAGVGKSRLAREAVEVARRRGSTILVGRAVAGQGQVPLRPIAEAVHCALRAGGPPDIADLVAFRPALRWLVPEWREAEPEGDAPDPLLLREGVLRLVRGFARGHAALLVIEDIHWADPDTLAVLEYLADNVEGEPVLLVLTCRDEDPSAGLVLVRDLAARRVTKALELQRLSEPEIGRLVDLCAGSAPLPEPFRGLVMSRAEGVPFLAEELLASAAAAIAGGEFAGAPALGVPVSFADTVRRRLSVLEPRTVTALRAGAVLGRSFDWTLVGRMVDDDAVLDRLGQGVAAKLLDSEGAGAEISFRFRHALTRDALVGELLPHERARVARRGLAAIEEAHPGLSGPWCELAAELAIIAGAPTHAARLLLQAGRGALSGGALATAEMALQRARDQAGTDAALVADIEDALLEVLSLAGRTEEVVVVGASLLERLRELDAPTDRRAGAHLRLARAAIAGTRWDEASVHLGHARSLSEPASPVGASRIDALAAQVSMGRGRFEEAVDLARRALAEATAAGLAEVACEAWEVIGREARWRDLPAAERAFEEAAAVAAEHGLRPWRLRAMHELGTIESLGRMGVGRLHETRRLADEAGALSTAAIVDLQLAGTYAMRFEPEPALEAATRCAAAARRGRLGLMLPMALIHAAAAHAVAGARPEMEAAITEAMALAGEHADVEVMAWGHCRAVLSMLEEDRPRAIAELDRAIARVRRAPGMIPPACWGPWALLKTLEGIEGDVARAEADAAPVLGLPFERALLGYADAVALGRAGQPSEAVMAVERSDATLAAFERPHGYRHLALRLVAEAAIDDGWGEPVRWLREAMAFFEDLGRIQVVIACRYHLGRTGAPVPRRGRGSSVVPAELRAAGVTSREVDVLGLLAVQLSNREIAERLYLSTRTVEKHIERLMDKTGVRERSSLADVALRAGVASPSTS